MNTQKQEEQYIIDKLAEQKNAIKPSRQLLSTIIAQLPAQEPALRPQQPNPFPWFRLMIPAGMVLLVGGVFFATRFSLPNQPTEPVAVSTLKTTTQPKHITLVNPVHPEKALNLTSIAQEEQQIENEIAFDEFFEDELRMQEIDAALASF